MRIKLVLKDIIYTENIESFTLYFDLVFITKSNYYIFFDSFYFSKGLLNNRKLTKKYLYYNF